MITLVIPEHDNASIKKAPSASAWPHFGCTPAPQAARLN